MTWSATSVIISWTGAGTFAIADKKLYVLAVTLSIPDNAKLLQYLKSAFKRTIICNKFQPKWSIERKN